MSAIGEWSELTRKGSVSWKQWVAKRCPDITVSFLTRAFKKGESPNAPKTIAIPRKEKTK
jgi:hypothetical protein